MAPPAGTTREGGTPRRQVPVPALVPLRRASSGGGSGDGGVPLFVVTAGYGDLMALTQLARLLEGERPVYALQPPVPSPTPAPDIDALLGAYVAALRAAQPAGPYLLFGYSTGGLMAFAVAQTLVAAGERVTFLGLIDSPCGLSRWVGWAHRAARRLVGGWLERGGARLGRVGQMAARLLTDPGLAAHVDALAGYAPPPYHGTLTAILPQDPPWAQRFQQVGRWRRVARGGLHVERVPGDHDGCLRPPHVTALAACLDRCLDSSSTGTDDRAAETEASRPAPLLPAPEPPPPGRQQG